MNLYQSDSTAVIIDEEPDAPVKAEEPLIGPKHPYQVLQRLPADATPAQQDSAIQAVFTVENTHLSTRPDTLHLPGHDAGRDPMEVDIPQYYRETFFAKDSLLLHEVGGGRYGVAGVPKPYTIRGDDFMTSLLLGCLLLALTVIARMRNTLRKQARHLLHEPSALTTEVNETAAELRFQFFLVLQTCLILAITTFIYVQQCVADTFILRSQYMLIWIFFGCFVAYFALKTLLSWAVNNVFFEQKESSRWFEVQLFVAAAQGMMLFPFVLLHAYFGLSIEKTVVCMAVVIAIAKSMLFYKCKMAFFRQKGGFIQNILYFCALEIVPLLSMLGAVAMIVDHLKINY